MGRLLSNDLGKCKNLSVFLCPKRAYVFSSEQALQIGLQQVEGRGIRIGGICELACQELSFPPDNVDQQNYLNIFVHVIKLITREDSYIVQKSHNLAETLILKEDTLDDFKVQDGEFYTKLLFYINNRVQLYLQSCYYNPPEEGPALQHLDFTTLIKMI